ncbi:hypothetical protein PF010_g30460, partial [Phytophthora fragariae]
MGAARHLRAYVVKQRQPALPDVAETAQRVCGGGKGSKNPELHGNRPQ